MRWYPIFLLPRILQIVDKGRKRREGERSKEKEEREREINEFLVEMCDDPAVSLSNGQTDI